jgi:hypothetical protein
MGPRCRSGKVIVRPVRIDCTQRQSHPDARRVRTARCSRRSPAPLPCPAPLRTLVCLPGTRPTLINNRRLPRAAWPVKGQDRSSRSDLPGDWRARSRASGVPRGGSGGATNLVCLHWRCRKPQYAAGDVRRTLSAPSRSPGVPCMSIHEHAAVGRTSLRIPGP